MTPPPARPIDATAEPRIFATLLGGIRSGDFRTEGLLPGSRVHHYEVLDRMGRGGMSVIYAARHVYLDNRVALKSVRPDIRAGEVGERFLREATVLASLAHPGVIRILDAGYHERIPYIITEMLEGETVKARLAREGTLTQNQALDLLEQVARVLHHQESKGIVHRDIKPSNIFVRPDGSYCLFDYGISDLGRRNAGSHASGIQAGTVELTATGMVMGTPGYMSPEQVRADPDIDVRSDIFSLGLTVWECLAGRPVRTGDSFVDIARQALEPVPSLRSVRPEVRPEVETIVRSMTSVSTDERYGSAAELLEDVEEYRRAGRRPHGATVGSAFIAIPFSPAFDDTFTTLSEACLSVGLSPRRIDKLVYVEDIWGQIVREIEEATVVIADFSSGPHGSGPNPNVVTEAAHARAVGKPILVIDRDPAEALPFDWRHVPVVRYDDSESGRVELGRDVLPRLRHCLRETGRDA